MYKRFFFLAVFTIILAEINVFSSDAGRVLVLNSYHLDYKWTADTVKGIESVLASHPSIRTSVEYMDVKRASSDLYFKHLSEIYKIKYSNTSFDAVICSDNDALNFLKKYRDDIFPGVPVIFCGINNFIKSDIEGMSNVTGVNEQTDIKSTVDVIIAMQPDVNRILVINDATDIGLRFENRINEIAGLHYKNIEFRFLKGDMNDIFKSVGETDNNTAVLFTVFTKDTGDNYYDYNEIILRLRNVTRLPVYGLWDFHLGYGIIGGKLISGFYQGKTAAELALKILTGTSIEALPVIMGSPNMYMFDFIELKKFKLDSKELPGGSIVINHEPGILEYYEMHKHAFITMILIFFTVILFLFSIILIRERRNRKKSIHSENMLRSILDSITEAVFITTPEGLLVDANTEAKNRLSLSDNQIGSINIFDYFQEEVTLKRQEYIKLVIETKMPVSFTDERDGLILLNNIYPIVDDENRVDLLSIASSDITFIKRNEELFNNIIANAPMGVIYVTIEGSIILANHIAESILYIKKNDNKGRWEKIEGTPDVPFITGNTIGWPLTLAIESGKPLYNFDSVIEREGNYKQYVSLNVAPIRDIHDRLSGLIVMILDVTDVKIIQMELSDSKNKLSSILESINDGFFAINGEGILTYVNSQAEETWGLTSDKIIGKHVESVFKKKYFTSVYEHFEQALKKQIYSQLEYHESHTKKWFMLHFYPYSDGISIYFTDITYRKDMEFKLKEMAMTDVLTGVMNRRAGISIIEKNILSSTRDNKPLTICFMDVDGLKSVNDTFGHNEGDRLLTDVSQILLSVFRGSDTLCRLGGDEFLAVLPGCDSGQTDLIRDRIKNYLKKANDIGDHPYPLEVSIGFALYPSGSRITADEFITIADSEMYKDKQLKKRSNISASGE
jgi:diguanylate cyclase (GGDEF)-like protein/PAS domain S-box-containing protein